MKRTCILLFCMVLIFLLGGCTGKNHDLLTEAGSENGDLLTEAGLENGGQQESEEGEENTNSPERSDNIQESVNDTKDAGTIFVYVCGCVVNPAVYELKTDARVYEAIELAGGFSEGAAAAALNLAENMADGQKIYVPSVEEQIESAGQETSAGQSGTKESGLVNLNTATKEQLMTLSGIGEAKADSILSYREDHGAFSSIEDIMKIDGIKEGVFNKIKDDITV